MRHRRWRNMIVMVLLLNLGGCAQTVIQPKFARLHMQPVYRPEPRFVSHSTITPDSEIEILYIALW